MLWHMDWLQEAIYCPADGCYGVGEDYRDYILGQDIDPIDLAPVMDDIHYFYNQATMLGWELSSFCTWMSPIQVLSSMWNYEMTQKDWESLWKFCQEKYWYVRKVWNLVHTWVKATLQRWNMEKPEYLTIFIRVPNLIDIRIAQVWTKWYGVCSWYRWDSTYNRDRDDNGVVDGSKFWSTYGHAVPLYKGKKHIASVYDSYQGRKTNVYELKDIVKLRENNVYFPTGYILVPNPDNKLRQEIDKRRKEMNAEIAGHMATNSSQWHAMAQYPGIQPNDLQGIRSALAETNRMYRKITWLT